MSGVTEELVPGIALHELVYGPAPGELSGELEVAASHAAFEGHFPGRPILPAVAQVQLVVALGARLLGRDLQVAEIGRMKFVRPVAPGARLTFRVLVEEQHLHFSLRQGDEVVSSGVFGVEPP